MASNNPDSNRDKMPKQSERGVADYLFWGLFAVVALKVLGLTKAWINIDPEGVSLSFGIGEAISLVLFGLLWKKLDGIRKNNVEPRRTNS